MKVVVTGSSGFIGTRLMTALDTVDTNSDSVSVRGSLSLPEGDVLVHLAAIAHSSSDDRSHVFQINRDLAMDVATRARKQGYRQFIFLSSAMVWGSKNEMVSLAVPEQPDTFYGLAKLAAEKDIASLGSADFTVSIVRPPLVYGPGVKGNLNKLLTAMRKWPVCPLGTSRNKRSMLHVDNLCAFIMHLIKERSEHSETLSGVFCPVDEPAISSLEILQNMGKFMAKHALLVEPPVAFQRFVEMTSPVHAKKLFGSFVIDGSSARATGFASPFSMEDGFRKMVQEFLSSN